MTEDTTPAVVPENVNTPSFLEQVKAERQAMEKARDEARQEREKLEQLRAEEMMSGRTNAGQPQQKPKEETPAEYTKRIMAGDGKYGEP